MSILRGGLFKVSRDHVLRTTPIFEAYWRFAYERQEIFFKRIAEEPYPWTDDKILQEYRFTNVYRASDRVSQYLIRRVIYEGEQSEQEIFFRILLFKFFNRIETWEALLRSIGEISWKTFDFNRYDGILSGLLNNGQRIYSSAYIMPSPMFGRKRKHSNHLVLLAKMMGDRMPIRITMAHSLRGVFELLRGYPSLGDFLAFQFAIDLNYSPLSEFSEMDYIVAGPGARSGIRKAFTNTAELRDESIIQAIAEHADEEFEKRGLKFRSLWGRQLQLIDCQNLFCEIDKYSRVAYPDAIGTGRVRIKRRFAPASDKAKQWYPPKWHLSIPD